MHVNAHLDVDVVALENDDIVTVMLDLEAPVGDTDATRPDYAAVVVLDRSGSMSGAPLAAAKRGLLDLVDRLDERDSFGLVVFDDRALPVSVNVVPQDVAQGRVPDPEVRRQAMLLEVQSAKRQSERAMRSGDVESARVSLSAARDALSTLGPRAGAEVADELADIARTLDMLDDELPSAIRLTSAGRTKRSRGYSGRLQGGEVLPTENVPDEDEESS